MAEDTLNPQGHLLIPIIKKLVNEGTFRWLEEKGTLIRHNKNATALSASFAAVPRKTGRSIAEIPGIDLEKIKGSYNGLSIKNWPVDKLARLWLLLQVDTEDEAGYHNQIESLFRDAEMNELVALYASLPVFAYPDSWQLRTAEGIRSNIGTVLESIMYDNPYPAKYLSESCWNQLVLKAFFNDKDVNRIIGLDSRANKTLASVLIDYAHERQAAHRSVNPQLWRLISKFIDENTIGDIEKLYEDGHITVRRAAVLACSQSDFEPARQLLKKEPVIYSELKEDKFNWSSL